MKQLSCSHVLGIKNIMAGKDLNIFDECATRYQMWKSEPSEKRVSLLPKGDSKMYKSSTIANSHGVQLPKERNLEEKLILYDSE